MTGKEIQNFFLEFFEKRGHKIVPSSSLLSNDPSVLFTTAGMQQFKPYYLGEKSPFGNNVASVQKCFRTSDIDSVGDESHLTFFEMLGNFSFAASAEAEGEGGAGYFKEKAIEYAYEFIAKELKLKIDYVSVFEGDAANKIPADDESEKIWKKIAPEIEIKKAGREDNFWGPTGKEGPCGPTTEIYVNSALRQAQGKPPLEVWNVVFNEYLKDENGNYTKLKTPGVDTGMGLERLTMVVQNKPTVFETDLFSLLMKLLPENLQQSSRRIVADHCRGIAFLLADGLKPSNKEQGYVLRRLMRRVIVIEYLANKNQQAFSANDILKTIIDESKDNYPNLSYSEIMEAWADESIKFSKTLEKGLREIDKLTEIDAAVAFKIYESLGLPYEVIKDYAPEKTKKLNREDFDEEFKKHQEISRAGLEKKFGGHGLKEGGPSSAFSGSGMTKEDEQRITRLHTATHLLHQALFDVLGDQVKQMGSDINSERLRFDFPFERKLTAEELGKIEAIVNEKIKAGLPVKFEEKSKDEAISEGAKAFFKIKYPDKVKVYSIGDYSKEICNGPHIENTGEIGKFKILKEESVGAGVRRIKATVE